MSNIKKVIIVRDVVEDTMEVYSTAARAFRALGVPYSTMKNKWNNGKIKWEYKLIYKKEVLR